MPIVSRRLIAIAVLLAATSVPFACAKAEGPPPTALGVITATAQDLPVINNLPGRLAPTRIAEVRPRVSGIVVERVFRQGSLVKAGDVLYRIDSAPFRLRVQSAQATLQRAKAVQLQARQQAGRVSELRSRNVASQQQSESATATLAQADAEVAEAEAGLASAKLDLEYSEVRAPISGRIGRALITEGALVGTGTAEVLARIQQFDPVYADFTQSVGEMLALRRALKIGSLTDPNAGTPNVRLMFDDGTPYPHTGRLLFSEAAVDETTGQVTLRGEFPNPDGDLLPGMYMRVALEQGVQAGVIAVPQQAVRRDGGGQPQLYILKPDGTLELRPVRTGRTLDNRQVIEDGVRPGEQVVVEGFQKVRPGATFTGAPWQPASESATGKQG